MTMSTTTAVPDWLVFEEDLSQDPTSIVASALDAVPSYKFYGNSIEIFFDDGPHIYYRFDEKGVQERLDSVTTVLGVINKPFLVPWAAKMVIETLKGLMFRSDGSIKDFTTEELLGWFQEAKNRHKHELNKAGDIGHLAHNALETSIKFAIENTKGIVLAAPTVVNDQFNPATEENISKAQNCANHAYKWMQDHNVRWLHTERKIYSRTYNYTGTLDGDALIDSCTDRFCKGCRGRSFKDRRAITDWKSSNHLADSYAYQTAAYQFAHIEEFPDLYIPDRWIMRLGKEEGDFEAWYLPDEYFEADFEAFLAAMNLYRSLEEIEGRRRSEKREFNEMVKATRKAERVAAEEAEKIRKAEEREALATAKKNWDASAATYYKTLRDIKIPKVDAERQRDEKFPKSQRPGAKEEIVCEHLRKDTHAATPDIWICMDCLVDQTGAVRADMKGQYQKPVVAPTRKAEPGFAAPGTWKLKL